MKSLRALSQKVFVAVTAAAGIEVQKTAEISALVVQEEEMRKLNRTWRGHDSSTNVLSFPTGDSEILGDIVLCEPVIRREAEHLRKTYDSHLTHMLAHGMLHLLGFDHETRAEAERMERIEVKALKKLGEGNPYAQ